MISEILNFYMQHKIGELTDKFVSKQDYQKDMKLKLDSSDFNTFKKVFMNNKETDEAHFRLDQKIFAIERKLTDFVPKDNFTD